MYNKQISEGAAGVCSGAGSGGGSVSRWSLGLEQLLADPAGAAAFAHFLAKEFAAENIRFWWSCEQYMSCEDPARRTAMASEIWQRHLSEGASEPVNVDAAARRAAALRLCHNPPPTDLFQQAQKQIFNVMKFDSYPRFLRSGVHAECARADLCGLPLPYAADTPSKLKKSASNASERRRSGGASLLPWKSRAASKDRANTTDAEKAAPPVTDVVKSSQTGQCSLCRVVLPDGATSVVGVEAAVTVRALVDRLLQRRNLHCLTYDVLLKDNAQGESPSIELNSPSSVLGGREVVVERRAVVRIEVCGRCVAVRCRAARRLRHVLRPVLARYAAPHRARLVLRDGEHVRADTLMQDLDGARLQIVEVSENGEWRAAAGEGRDDDADSLSDLAVRLQDDDALSASAASSSSRSRGDTGSNGPLTSTSSLGSNGPSLGSLGPSDGGLGPSNGGLGPSNGGLGPSNGGLGPSNGGLGPSNGGLGPGNGVNGANGGPSGRVRAALRSGPPLHHHPPDFLDNLRETQRQRLQPRSPPPAARAPRSPPPAPRAPPPLPPKPPHRAAPTLV